MIEPKKEQSYLDIISDWKKEVKFLQDIIDGKNQARDDVIQGYKKEVAILKLVIREQSDLIKQLESHIKIFQGRDK